MQRSNASRSVWLLSRIAALAIAGVGLAAAQDAQTLKVDLPDGSVARIEYSGNIAPKVTLAQVSRAVPVTFVDAWDSMPLAALNHVATEMDRQAAAMIYQAAQLHAPPKLAVPKLRAVASDKPPSGTVRCEFVLTTGESGTCTRTVELTSYGAGQKPRLVSISSGDCRQLDRAPEPVLLDSPVHPSIPGVAKPQMTNMDRTQVDTIV